MKAYVRFAERMGAWLVSGILFYLASMAVGIEHPQLQTALWKLGHVTIFAWLGYLVACRTTGRVAWENANTQQLVARAIIIGAAMIAGAHGL